MSSFPESDFEKHARRPARNDRTMLLISGSMVLILFVGCMVFDWYGELIGFAMLIGILLSLVATMNLLKKRDYGIEIYLDRPVERGTKTLFKGQAVFCMFAALEKICADMNISTLSSFGFADDQLGETPSWHECDEGLAVLDRLLREIEGAELDSDKWIRVYRDLQLWRARLRDGKDCGAKFCLILRTGSGVCGMEFDQRKGYF